jgi:hypothetical protein
VIKQFGYTKVRSRAGEEHCTTGDAVCPVEPMDGRRHLLASAGECACNAENGRRKVLATAESTEMSG